MLLIAWNFWSFVNNKVFLLLSFPLQVPESAGVTGKRFRSGELTVPILSVLTCISPLDAASLRKVFDTCY